MELSVVCSKLITTGASTWGRSMQDIATGAMGLPSLSPARILRYEDMDIDNDRRGADAEAERQQHELARQTAERARAVAEELRVSAEHGRRVVAEDVRETIATLTTLLGRMEAVEALRREAGRDTK
jgi:hypothetical protein